MDETAKPLVYETIRETKPAAGDPSSSPVRDNIHALDVARFIHAFIDAPRVAEVDNLGGGRGNSCSIVEASSWCRRTGNPQRYVYVDEARAGDDICYSDLRKMLSQYPAWGITRSLDATVREMVEAWRARPTPGA